jgi:hypothetical protein
VLCTANPRQFCGGAIPNPLFSGNAAISIYSTYPAYIGPCAGNPGDACGAPSPTLKPAPYHGCYRDNNPNQVFPGALTLSTSLVTTQACAAGAKAAAYSYAGLENGGQCFGGDKWDLEVTTKIPEAQCSVACSGDASEKCGGLNALSVYGPLP